MNRDELTAWLRLLLTPRIGPATARQLLATFGLPQRVFEAAAQELPLTPRQAQALRDPPAGLADLVATTEAWLADGRTDTGVSRRLVTLADPDYPPALLQAPDPPLVLHVMGAPLARGPIDWPTQALAMVGSRNPTPQGAQTARQFAHHIAGAGWTVISGLALGIDGAAHEGALDGGRIDAAGPHGLAGPAAGTAWATVAVVGTGLDRVYPRRHLDLAHRIAAHGVLVSEHPLGTPPLRDHFPRRNRIIAALSRGTLVVEAAVQSGSLITAHLAADLGREVFAIPGSIHAPQSRGCHALIRQGAQLVETADEVLDALMPQRAAACTVTPPAAAPIAPPPGADDPVLQALGHDPVGFDALSARTGLPTAVLQARLLALELDGEVARLPGGVFQRLARA
jgi:DNA processing protein